MEVVGKVVLLAQIVFGKMRRILDATLIANEATDSLLKRKECGVLCKLDIEMYIIRCIGKCSSERD